MGFGDRSDKIESFVVTQRGSPTNRSKLAAFVPQTVMWWQSKCLEMTWKTCHSAHTPLFGGKQVVITHQSSPHINLLFPCYNITKCAVVVSPLPVC